MWHLVLSLSALASSLFARGSADRRPSSPIQVNEGLLQGSCNAQGFCQYLGIPYAAPPLGELRWRPPQPASPWSGVLDASRFGSKCLQTSLLHSSGKVVGSEDCLFLNVYAPPAGKCRGTGCAVMFWIHGGGYMAGSADQFNGSNLVALGEDVIIVTTNYRLGVMGFLGSQALRERDVGSGSTGNYGIQDQRAALAWVQQNIHKFGGNSSNVMIFGQSAGAGSVLMHMFMQRSWPLYTKAAIQSGFMGAQPMETAEQIYVDLLAAVRCGTKGSVQCLAEVDAARMIGTSLWGLPARSQTYARDFAPVVDGVELKGLPWVLRDQGRFNRQVPVLLGYNRDEGTLGVDLLGAPSKIYQKVSNMTAGDFSQLITAVEYSVDPNYLPHILDVYSVDNLNGGTNYTSWYWVATHFRGDYMFSCPSRKTARAVNKFSSHSVFFYYYAHTPRAPPPAYDGVKGINNTSGASHETELDFLWLIDRNSTRIYEDGFLIGDDEKRLAKTIAGYWINFARTSNPNVPGLGIHANTSLTVNWEPFTAGHEASLGLALDHLSMKVGRNDRQCDLMDWLGVLTPGHGRRLRGTEGPILV